MTRIQDLIDAHKDFKTRIQTINRFQPKKTTPQRRNPNHGKPVMTPLGRFETVREAAAALGKTIPTFYSWLKKKPTEYYYIGEEE